MRETAKAAVRPPADLPIRRILFVTGKLAEPALRRTLGELRPEISARLITQLGTIDFSAESR